jgi:NADH-quinone oxidoreductase subunit C
MTRLEKLSASLKPALADKLVAMHQHVGEITIEATPADLIAVCTTLRDHAELKFEQLIDLCGLDYSSYGEGAWLGARFAVCTTCCQCLLISACA